MHCNGHFVEKFYVILKHLYKFDSTCFCNVPLAHTDKGESITRFAIYQSRTIHTMLGKLNKPEIQHYCSILANTFRRCAIPNLPLKVDYISTCLDIIKRRSRVLVLHPVEMSSLDAINLCILPDAFYIIFIFGLRFYFFKML